MAITEAEAHAPVVRVGVGVIILHPDHPRCALVGVRRGSHGAGTLALPGGHLEMGEEWADCAVREVKEETDLDIDKSSVRFVYATNDVFDPSSKHYITLFVTARLKPDSPPLQNKEPHKCDGWSFVSWAVLQRSLSQLFMPLRHACEDEGFDPFPKDDDEAAFGKGCCEGHHHH